MKTPVRPIMKREDPAITIYWWNLGTKQLDYKGPLSGFLLKKGITITRIVKKGVIGYKCKVSTSSTNQIIEIYSSYLDAAVQAIIAFLTMMGDKALFIAPYTIPFRGREYKINWR